MPLDDTALCTVCIPTYNQSEYLRKAIKSVALQTAPVRLLVSNDASPDDTATPEDFAQPVAAVHQTRSPGRAASQLSACIRFAKE